MDIRVSNQANVAVGIIDSVESIIWVERYNDVGEFEITNKFSYDLYSLLQEDYLLTIPQSDRTMIVETVIIESDPDSGPKLTVKGRSLESIIDRRIVLRQILIDGSLQTGVQSLLNENIISSIYPTRDIPGFVFSASSNPAVTSLTMKAQYYSENLLDVIQNICRQAGLGFKLIMNASNQYVFSLYAGIDRSHGQLTNPYVVFSPDFDNLISSEYYRTKRYKKNYVLVSGDPNGEPGLPLRQQVWDYGIIGEGINRREMFSEASDIPKVDDVSGIEIPDADYLLQLNQRGLEELARNNEVSIFDGQIDLSSTYTYKTDFFLGDIVQMIDEYGHNAKTQIAEITFSENVSGYNLYPTLKSV